ncbi:hypothetical protein WA026_020774 [Henosepilachna vigintioctopunctata]|uniref:Major facilitator superfamily (MFS) profile domain-containing protein n=1 Tax=Henosepilachna vigintioctopunctata TaxID=420089 RepID=A0AAW1TXB8_9CUCU
MTFKQPKEKIIDETTPSRYYPVYVTYISIFFLLLTSGSNVGWSSPMIQKLNRTEDNPIGPLTEDERSWVVSISILGTLTGSLICGGLGQILGRKILITAMGIPYVIFYVTIAFAKELWLLLLARFIGGLSAGGLLAVLPLYISEIADFNMRGRLFVFICVSSNLGTLITYSTAPFISFFWYHICNVALPMIFLILFPIFALESPYYIVQKDPVRSEQILKKLRGNSDVTKEIERIKMAHQTTSNMNLLEVFRTKETRKALLIMWGLSTFLMITGYVVVMSYTQLIFESAGAYWSPEVQSIILSAFQVFASLLSSLFADRFGRKSLFAVSFSALAFSEVAFGTYLIFKDNGSDVSNYNKWLPILSLMICIGASSFLSIAPSTAGELFSLKAKNVATAMCTFYSGMLGFLTTLLFQKIKNAIGLGQTFLMFAAFSICATIFVLTVMIETKGKTLEQIQDELGSVKAKKSNGRPITFIS